MPRPFKAMHRARIIYTSYLLLIILIIAGCCSVPSYTQTHKLPDYPKSFVRDTADILQAPLHWNHSDIKKLATYAGIAGSLIIVADKPVKQYAADHRNKTMDKITRFVVPFGTIGKVETAAFGAYALSYGIGDYQMADTSFMVLESAVIAHGFVGILKGITKRQRPDITDNPDKFFYRKKLIREKRSSGFPSGDVTAAFSWASVVAERSESPTVDVISYGIAGLVMVERVYFNAHWTSDTWGGAVLGTAIGKAIVKFNRNNTTQTSLIPIINQDYSGLAISIKF